MASTYTSRIRLEKQADGENPNSWGLILNQNVIDLIDESIAGYETVSVSSVAVSLTNNSGATDQSRNFGLKVMGTLTANVTIGIPAQEKIYFIHNGTSGDYDVFIKPTGGTAVTAAQQGFSSVVATNGTLVNRLDTGSANSLTVTANTSIGGTLTVNGETTLKTHLNMADNDKIKLGDSGDLEIYHDASNSYIADTGTGELRIKTNNLNVQNAAGNESLIGATEDAGVSLYFNNASKLVTNNTGVTITGIVSATSFAGNGSTLSNVGKTLQVVQAGYGTSHSLTTSYATTNLALAISTTSASNKVLVQFNVYTDTRSNSTSTPGKAVFKLYRGSTDLGYIGSIACEGGRLQTMAAMQFLDSPGSAASHTYTLYAKKELGSVDLHDSDMIAETSQSRITCTELVY
tara:strand:+ start:2063 stop:3274 length:1212 start_codon:yes stop_codon:yes gene_type:complete